MDLQSRQRHETPVLINGDGLEMVNTCKFLELHLNNKLDRSSNTRVLYRKGQNRLFFLRRGSSFNLDMRLIRMF